MGRAPRRCTARACLILPFAVTALLTAIASVIFGSLVFEALTNLRSNQVGDTEKQFVDNCLRDYESLGKTSPEYVSKRSECVRKLDDEESLSWIPKIRLTVDERICEVASLCSEDDPQPCTDSGNPRTRDFRPGNITFCYELIDESKRPGLTPLRRNQLAEEVEQRCTRADRWANYEKRVLLDYCMWKHFHSGVCTNELRSTCIPDGSCCPQAQNLDNVDQATRRPDPYTCVQSPIVGLFCQYSDWFQSTAVNTSATNRTTLESTHRRRRAEIRPPLCTSPTCESFAWCRDFADLPGECYSDACKEYERSKSLVIVCILLAACGLLCDLGDLMVCWSFPAAAKPKATLNVSSATLKLASALLCLAAGVGDFTDTMVAKSCFAGNGSDMAENANATVSRFVGVTITSTVFSLCLAPMSMQWGGRLTGLPYVRITA